MTETTTTTAKMNPKSFKASFGGSTTKTTTITTITTSTTTTTTTLLGCDSIELNTILLL